MTTNMTSNLGTDLSNYYAKQFFFMSYPNDRERAQYEWDYYQSDHYKSFIKQAEALNTATGRPYTDKRTRGWKFFTANEKKTRKACEQLHPVPKKPKP